MTLQSLRAYIHGLAPHVAARQQAILLMRCEALLAEAIEVMDALMDNGGAATVDRQGQESASNGWDYDWWIFGIKAKKRIMVMGSGFYGGISIGEESIGPDPA